ncbi:Protein SOSEKI 1 [Exophiala xenobiotica]
MASSSSKPTSLKSTMHPGLDIPPKGDSHPEDSRDFSHEPGSFSDKSSYQDVFETAQADGQVPCNEPLSLHVQDKKGEREGVRERIRIPACTTEDDVDALLHATLMPPVTKETLEELDLMWIQSNINLRVDINYDHDLHFMPVSGHKGEQKRQEAKKYWLSLEAELRIVYQHNLQASCSCCQEARPSSPVELQYFTPRLRQMFLTLKELLAILIPDRHQDEIVQYLDISLLLQEVTHGLLDVVRLARWLCVLLTTHCAPMRDDSAQEMAEQIREGAERGDLHALVTGIEKLFAFLEAMKLDVANHQIRSFRYHLIDDTVAFQQEYFRLRIVNEKLNVTASRQWYLDASQEHQQCQMAGQTPRTMALGALVHGLTELCISSDRNIPETLKHDRSRLKTIREEIQDIVHLRISLTVYNTLVQQLRGPPSKDPTSLKPMQNRLEETRSLLQNRLMDLTEGSMGPDTYISEMWLRHAHSIGLELTRAAFYACRPTPPIPEIDVAKKITELLKQKFSREASDHAVAREIAGRLEKNAHKHAMEFQNMTTLNISEAQKQWNQVQQQKQQWRNLPHIDGMARMLAHIAVLNMRVWKILVYLAQDGDALDGDLDSISEASESNDIPVDL